MSVEKIFRERFFQFHSGEKMVRILRLESLNFISLQTVIILDYYNFVPKHSGVMYYLWI